MRKSRRLVVLLLGTAGIMLGALLVAEATLYAVRAVSPRVDYLLSPPWTWNQPVEDDMLGVKGSPYHPEHDGNGYRNERAVESADVVTLGDSHTYGTSVPASASWPNVIARRSGLSVYNMGFGGYSPVHSRLQLESALGLSPSLLVVTVYFGNDFFDCYTRVRDGAVSPPPDLGELAAAASALESESPVEGEVAQLVPEPEFGEVSAFRRLLSTRSSLYAALRSAKALISPAPTMDLYSQDFDRAVASLTAEQEGFYSVVDGPEWRTVLTAPQRARVLDAADPRIRLGFEMCVRSLVEIHGAVAGSGTSLHVVFLPTKESVFWPKVDDPAGHPGLEETYAREAELRDRLTERLRSAGVSVVDPLGALQEAASQPYFGDADGHPNPLGHEIIAQEILDRLSS